MFAFVVSCFDSDGVYRSQWVPTSVPTEGNGLQALRGGHFALYWPALGIRNGPGGVGAPVHHLRQPVCGRGSDVGVFLPSLEARVPIRAKLAEAARVDLDEGDCGRDQ